MAGPQFLAAGGRSQSASAASLAPAKPTVLGQNGLLVCLVTSKNNAVHATATAGWTKLGQTNSGASFTASVFTAAEGAGAPTVTWTGAAACSAQIAYYAAPDNTVDTTIGASTSSAGTTSPHASSALTTTRDNSLAVYIDAVASLTGTSTPSGWTLNSDASSGTDTERVDFGSKAVASAGGSSGAISVTGAAAAWVQWQIELMGGAPAAGLQASKVELDAWVQPRAGLSAAKVELDAWVQPGVGLTASKVELVAWLKVGQTYAPAAGAIVLAGQTPAVSSATTLSPGAGAITLGGATPAVSQAVTLSPASGAIVLAGQTPLATYTTAVADDVIISILW